MSIQEARGEVITALDIGAASVRAVMGEILPDRSVNIIAAEETKSAGISKGGICDIEAAVGAIKLALARVSTSARCPVQKLYCSITGTSIWCSNQNGMVSLAGEVTEEDISFALDTAKRVKLPAESSRLIHSIEQSYTIDGQKGIKNPIGIAGLRLEAFSHLVSCNEAAAKNIENCVAKANGVNVYGLVFSGIASAYSVLSQEEKELGACVIDIGKDVMDICVYTGGALRYSGTIPYASGNATRDVSQGSMIPESAAEKLKRDHCSLDLEDLGKSPLSASILTVSGQKRNINLLTVAQVLKPRFHELFEQAQKKIKAALIELQQQKADCTLGAGIVLTGGGSKMRGLLTEARSVFNSEVRLGKPSFSRGLCDKVNKPEFATAVGILKYAADKSPMEQEENGRSFWRLARRCWLKIKEMY